MFPDFFETKSYAEKSLGHCCISTTQENLGNRNQFKAIKIGEHLKSSDSSKARVTSMDAVSVLATQYLGGSQNRHYYV